MQQSINFITRLLRISRFALAAIAAYPLQLFNLEGLQCMQPLPQLTPGRSLGIAVKRVARRPDNTPSKSSKKEAA